MQGRRGYLLDKRLKAIKAPAMPEKPKTSASKFPQVQKLFKLKLSLGDIIPYYRSMREALVTANREIGGYKGWATRWKDKFEAEQLEKQKLEVEKKQLTHDKQILAGNIREISKQFKDMSTTVAKLQAFEAAVNHLAEIKAVADERQHSAGYWSVKSIEDLSRAVDTFLETVDEILNDDTQSEVG